MDLAVNKKILLSPEPLENHLPRAACLLAHSLGAEQNVRLGLSEGSNKQHVGSFLFWLDLLLHVSLRHWNDSTSVLNSKVKTEWENGFRGRFRASVSPSEKWSWTR